MEQRHHQPSSRQKPSGHLVYERVTRGIRVLVRPAFLDDQSDPEASRYLWSYTVTIENKSPRDGPADVPLLAHHRCVGHIQEVRGPGVVGAQPVLEPGQVFEYTSGCPLPTASGAMAGRYQMRPPGEAFEAEIPAFLLESPHERRQIH
jgi:ApaG protein